jgi:hypothetical protein
MDLHSFFIHEYQRILLDGVTRGPNSNTTPASVTTPGNGRDRQSSFMRISFMGKQRARNPESLPLDEIVLLGEQDQVRP